MHPGDVRHDLQNGQNVWGKNMQVLCILVMACYKRMINYLFRDLNGIKITQDRFLIQNGF